MTSLFNASLNASSFFNYPNCNMKSPVTNSTIRVVQRSINYSTGHLAGWDFFTPGGDHQKINDVEQRAADEIA